MAFTYKIFNSRTGVEVEETKEFDSTDANAFGDWLATNNTCYEQDDVNKPENDACDYELKVFNDGNQVYFNPETSLYDLTEEPVVVDVVDTEEE